MSRDRRRVDRHQRIRGRGGRDARRKIHRPVAELRLARRQIRARHRALLSLIRAQRLAAGGGTPPPHPRRPTAEPDRPSVRSKFGRCQTNNFSFCTDTASRRSTPPGRQMPDSITLYPSAAYLAPTGQDRRSSNTSEGCAITAGGTSLDEPAARNPEHGVPPSERSTPAGERGVRPPQRGLRHSQRRGRRADHDVCPSRNPQKHWMRGRGCAAGIRRVFGAPHGHWYPTNWEGNTLRNSVDTIHSDPKTEWCAVYARFMKNRADNVWFPSRRISAQITNNNATLLASFG